MNGIKISDWKPLENFGVDVGDRKDGRNSVHKNNKSEVTYVCNAHHSNIQDSYIMKKKSDIIYLQQLQ